MQQYLLMIFVLIAFFEVCFGQKWITDLQNCPQKNQVEVLPKSFWKNLGFFELKDWES